MKTLRCLSLLLLAACATRAAPNAVRAAAQAPLRVMSFNVRLAAAQDGENAWSKRRGLFFETIEQFQPDLIGFQEVLAVQYEAIAEQLKG